MTIRKVIFWLLYVFRIGDFLRFFNKRKVKIPILLFHRVSRDYDPFTEPLCLGKFEKIIGFLSKRYTIYPLESLFTKQCSDLKNACFITFDDGMLDVYENALPVLVKYNVPICFFVPLKAVNKQSTTWNCDFFGTMHFSSKNTFPFVIKGKEFYINKMSKEYNDLVQRILLEMFQLTGNEIEHSIKELKELAEPVTSNFAPVTNWEQINEMSNNNVSIQSHSFSHTYLPNLGDEELKNEFSTSRKILEQMGFTSDYFAYPMGAYDSRTIKTCKEYYKAAFTSDNTLAEPCRILDNSDYRFQIPRFNITTDDYREIYLRINGFHNFFLRARSYFKL